MESSVKTILLEFKLSKDQSSAFENELIDKLKDLSPSENLQLIYRKDQLPEYSKSIYNSPLTTLNVTFTKSSHEDEITKCTINLEQIG